jgi:hypothetical protein
MSETIGLLLTGGFLVALGMVSYSLIHRRRP